MAITPTDWDIPSSQGILKNVYAIQGQQQQNALRGDAIAGQNMLRRFYRDPNALDANTGTLKPQYVNMIGQVSPETAMTYMKDAQTLMRSRQLTETAGVEARQKFVQDMNLRLAPAKTAYDAVIKSGGSPQEAQQAAQAAGASIVQEAMAAGDVPAWAQPRMQGWRYDDPTYVANSLGRQGQQQLAVKGQEAKTETDYGRSPPVQYLRYGDGRTTDITGQRPYTPSGVAEPKGAEATEYVGKEKGTGKEIAITRSSSSATGWVDATNKPVEIDGAPHKMGTKSEVAEAEAGTPTGPADLHGQEYIDKLPSSRAAMIKGYAEGRVPFPGSFSLRSPYWQKMVADITQYDPSFDAVNYNARARTRMDFTSGPSAKNVTSIDTAIGHMGRLLKSGEALNNSWSPAWNTVTNFLLTQTGDPRVKAFNVDRDAVATELTRAFRGTGGNVDDIKHWRENLDTASSPAQIRGAIEEGVELLASRINAVGEQYRRGMGTTADVTELLTPAAKKTLRQLPGGVTILGDLSTTIGGTRGGETRGEATSTAGAPSGAPAGPVTMPADKAAARKAWDDAKPGTQFVLPDGTLATK